MISNNTFQKESLLIELYKSKEKLDKIEKNLSAFINSNNGLNLNLKDTLNYVEKTKDSILNNIEYSNGFKIYIAKNNLTGEIYKIKETPFSYEEIENLKNNNPKNEIITYPIKGYTEFYNREDGIHYYNNEGIKKSLYKIYDNFSNK